MNDGPILLVPSEPPLPTAVSEALRTLACGHVTALGGTAAVSDEVRAAAIQHVEAAADNSE